MKCLRSVKQSSLSIFVQFPVAYPGFKFEEVLQTKLCQIFQQWSQKKLYINYR